MRSVFFHTLGLILAVNILILAGNPAPAEPQHGIAMYGTPVLPHDFVSLPYANPDSPKGGRIVLGVAGSFDSLNPLILKGRAPGDLRYFGYESLMGRNYNEPFSLYALLAESVETDANRTWVEFTLRKEARFSDGSPVTVEDVLWSYETLGTKGHPRYLGAWNKIASAVATGPRKVRFTFNVEDRELALIIGMRPILKKVQWQGKDFAASSLEVPITTAPYVIDEYEASRYLVLKRNPDYWGNDLPLRRGVANLDEIRMEFFADSDVMFEAFKAGEIDLMRESNSAKWDNRYNFPAIQSGEVVKSVIPNLRPSGISGLVMNMRNPVFADWRLREAMMLAFNYEFISQTLNGAGKKRISSYFSNSVLGLIPGPATGQVADLLTPFADDLLPGTLEGYSLPVSDGSERNRKNIRKAMALLKEAGWDVVDGVMQNDAGVPLAFEIVLKQGAGEVQTIVDIYVQSLKRLGIHPAVTVIDSAQYKERTNNYDFDMAFYNRGMSLSPGNEQMLYWGADGVTMPGSRNWMGMNSPAAEAMIENILNAPDQEGFRAATRALDRVLTAGRYVIPIWASGPSNIAHKRELHYPRENLPMYGDWIGFLPDVWWYEE
ncbi:extracellular solute-binding protein [Profundibacter sp.]